MRNRIVRAHIVVSLFVLLTAIGCLPAFGAGPTRSSRQTSANRISSNTANPTETVSVTIPIGPYQITETEHGQQIAVEDFGRLPGTGTPNLPSKIISVAIPPEATVVDVSYEIPRSISLRGGYSIAPIQPARVIGDENPQLYERDMKLYAANYASVYGSDTPYPAAAVEFVQTAHYRKYNLVDVRVTPFAYRPASGQLVYYPEVTVNVHYAYTIGAQDVIADNLPETEQIARDIIVNYDEAQQWYGNYQTISSGLHDFVIITLDTLTSSVTPLVDWEAAKGRSVEVVTTTWINANYTGDDLAEKIRNFLREKYPSSQWGIKDVLLVGDYNDRGFGIVPIRKTAQLIAEEIGTPRTDYYYAELSLPDSQSWDKNNNGLYGENSDPIDFVTEVNVGRIPWSDPATVQHICEKSVAYEQNNDPAYKQNILLLGAFFWANTDNAVLMEAKVNKPWMSDWTMKRLYEKNTDCTSTYACDKPLTQTNVRSVWRTGTFGFVNWAGHGSPVSAHILGMGGPAFVTSADCSQLNDNYPSIIFADACSNADTEPSSGNPSIAQAMLKRGAVGFLGATKVALGCPAWHAESDGSTQTLDYYFTTCVTSGDYTQGAAHQWALRQMYIKGYWDYVRYEMFEWGSLWGNPDLGMAPVSLTKTAAAPTNLFVQGWVWFSIPMVPAESANVSDVLGFNCTNRVYSWDDARKSIRLYPNDFTDLGVGPSYLARLNLGEQYTPSYVGTKPAMPFAQQLPAAGWCWVGVPDVDDIAGVDLRVVKNNVTRTPAEDRAAADPWINWNWIYWDPVRQSAMIMNPLGGSDDTSVHPWWGYRVWANTPDVTIMFP